MKNSGLTLDFDHIGISKMDKDEVIRLMREHFGFLMTEYGISRIGIFGSVVKGNMTEDSDLDIVVEFKKPIGFKFNKLVEYLENLFGRKVDVLTIDGIKNIRVKEVAKNIERTLVYV
ncbi:MAG: nucleotidyltransferase family protein [bacterium]